MNEALANWKTTAFGLAKFLVVVTFVLVKAKYGLVFSAEDIAIVSLGLGSAGSSVVGADAKPVPK